VGGGATLHKLLLAHDWFYFQAEDQIFNMEEHTQKALALLEVSTPKRV
jgi:hypothetical protein